MTNTLEIPAITSEKFREVLGHYPTGVAVIPAEVITGWLGPDLAGSACSPL